jgi:uncharacterized protein YacL
MKGDDPTESPINPPARFGALIIGAFLVSSGAAPRNADRESRPVGNNIRQALLTIGSIVALIAATLTTEFVFTYPSILSVFLFVTVVPALATLGIGLFMIVRDEFLRSKLSAHRRADETKKAAS